MARRRRGKRRSYRSRRNIWREAKSASRVVHFAPGHSAARRGKYKAHKRAGKRSGKRRVKRNRGGRRRSRNPGAGVLAAVRKPFNVTVLKSAAIMAAGAVGNTYLVNALKGFGFMPSMLTSGIGSYALGLGSAGLLSAGVNMVRPAWGGQVLAGAVMAEVARALKEIVLPKLGLGYFGDYLTPGNAAGALPLGYFGDYLTPGNAASALPLGGFSGDDTVSEELAAFA